MVEYDIEVIDADERSAEFVVRGITPAFANGIRRAMLADVPTLSIDTVRMIENSSVMFDEVIGLRLGLVPLTTPDDVREGEEITLSLDVGGPATAYSGDIETSDDLVEPAAKNIPIIELKEDQRLAFEADATLASGTDHAKHQGGVAVGYRHLRTVTIEGELGAYDERDPRIVRGVIEDDGELIRASEFDNDLTNRYPEQEVSVHDVENAFVFDVESDGSLSVGDLVTEAAQSIADRADELEDAVAL
jgi:DNA-directed RNA polymerase subunit D